MIPLVTIKCMTPNGAIAPDGTKMCVEISYPKGGGNTKQFDFFIIEEGFKGDLKVSYNMPTEIGGRERQTRLQITQCVRNLKKGTSSPSDSFQKFLEIKGIVEAAAFLAAFEEWVQKESKG